MLRITIERVEPNIKHQNIYEFVEEAEINALSDLVKHTLSKRPYTQPYKPWNFFRAISGAIHIIKEKF